MKTTGVTKSGLVHGICKGLKLQVPPKDMPYTADADPSALATLIANVTTLDHQLRGSDPWMPMRLQIVNVTVAKNDSQKHWEYSIRLIDSVGDQ